MTDQQITEGSQAPAFSLQSNEDKQVSLKDLNGKIVVLFFYPKDDTPGCTKEACAFRDNNDTLQKQGAVVLGVSKDNVASHKKFVEKYHLNFPLLADTTKEVCEAYGVMQEKSMYGKRYMGIVRSTFLIDESGLIRKIWQPVKVTGHETAVLKAIEALKTP